MFAQRICALMNHSFTEIDLFILSQGSTDPLKNFPYDFWLPQLEKFVTGDGCPLPAGTTVSCPAARAGCERSPVHALRVGSLPWGQPRIFRTAPFNALSRRSLVARQRPCSVSNSVT